MRHVVRAVLLGLAVLFAIPNAAFSADVSSSKARRYAKQLSLFVRGERNEAILDLIEELAELDHKRVAPLIASAGVALPSAANYKASLDAIKGLENDEAVEALVKMLEKKSGDFRAKVLIVEAFGYRDDIPSSLALIGQLKSRITHVQVAAIRAVRRRKLTKGVSELITIQEKHKPLRDRQFVESYLALVDITGQDFETIEDWRKWWKGAEKGFDPEEIRKGNKGKTKIELKTIEEGIEDSVQFFGSEVFSRNLLFVIDVSGSMQHKDKSEPTTSRVDRAKNQLAGAVKKMKKGTLFNIIAFSTGVRTWQKKLVPAHPKTIKQGLTFVENLRANGATHTDDAMEEAFKDLRVDTILLLSDGQPSKANQRGPGNLVEKILKRVADINSSRKVRIDTFGFDPAGGAKGGGAGGAPGGSAGGAPGGGAGGAPGGGAGGGPGGGPAGGSLADFLQRLAEQNGGKYRPIQ